MDVKFIHFVETAAGDVAVSYADASKAERQLGFKCKYGIEDMCIIHGTGIAA